MDVLATQAHRYGTLTVPDNVLTEIIDEVYVPLVRRPGTDSGQG
jgi:hypothetical protein